MNIGKVIGRKIRLATSLVGCGGRYELRPLFLGIALEWFVNFVMLNMYTIYMHFLELVFSF